MYITFFILAALAKTNPISFATPRNKVKATSIQFKAVRPKVKAKVEESANIEVPEDQSKKNREQPSIFISTYLSKESATLGQWMVATKDLPELDQKLKKCMVGRVVAITDKLRRGVIIGNLLRQSSFVDPTKIHIKSCRKLSIIEEFILMRNLAFDSLP